MVTRSMHRSRDSDLRPRFRTVSWLVSLIGVIAASIGAYIAMAPADGSITVIAKTWRTADLADSWAPWLLVIGGALAAIGLTTSAARERQQGGGAWLVVGEALLAAGGIVALIAGVGLLA